MRAGYRTIIGAALCMTLGFAGCASTGSSSFLYKNYTVADDSAVAGEGRTVLFKGSPLVLSGTAIKVGDPLRERVLEVGHRLVRDSGGQCSLAVPIETLKNRDNLFGCLALTEDDLGESAAESALVVDRRETSDFLERCLTQLFSRPGRFDLAGTDSL